MNAKKTPAQCYACRKLGLCVAIAAMLAILPGFARATLHPAVVGANIATNGIVGSWLTQSNGPHILNLIRDDRTAGVWTDYGVNKAGAWISATPYGGYVLAISRWEDQLTV